MPLNTGKIRVAVFQCEATGLVPAERAQQLIKAAEDAQADLLLCPELFMSGYNIGDNIRQFAEPFDGSFAEKVTNIAKTTNTTIVYGYPEAADGLIYNSAQCIDANGKRLANHRKLTLPPGFEQQYFSAGKDKTLFEFGGITFGILICYDGEFPEAVRATAEAGAQVVLIPTASVRQWPVVPYKVIPTRAFENGVYVLYANHAGTEGTSEYIGASCIVDPSGSDLSRSLDAEGVIATELDVNCVSNAQERIPYLSDSKSLRKRLN